MNGAAVNDAIPFPTPLHLTGGVSGAIENGVTNIIVCNLPPMGTYALYTAGKETERGIYNGLAAAWVTAHVADGAVLADLDAFLQDPGTPVNLDPRYDNGAGYPTADGQTALFVVISPLAPGTERPPRP